MENNDEENMESNLEKLEMRVDFLFYFQDTFYRFFFPLFSNNTFYRLKYVRGIPTDTTQKLHQKFLF